MRRIVFALLTTACVRPVLYYPTPESAGVRSAADSTTETPATNSGSDVRVPLMIGAGRYTNATTKELDEAYLLERRILMPVAGADITHVQDSFNEGRDGGARLHRAIDILAPRGTPILSADDGRILRMSTNALGGISMYTVDADARLVYYYAHMERYNDAMTPGRTIVRGDTLGYVGTTGNAPKNLPHLHFQVMRWPLDGKYWDGEPIDPYEALGGMPRTPRATAPKR